jgi:hypothetical protein
MGAATIVVDRPGAQILVLSSYEPVTWSVTAAPSADLQKIIAVGYHQQIVDGPANVPVEVYSYDDNQAFLGCAYEFPDQDPTSGCETLSLMGTLEALTNLKTSSFHGCYDGDFFNLKEDLSVTANCDPSEPTLTGFVDPDCNATDSCVGIDDDQNGTVDRQDCDLSAGPECVLVNDAGVNVNYCGVLCGCVGVDWDNDGTVESGTLCNVNASQCDPGFDNCTPSDLNSDGINDSFVCENGCSIFDADANNTLDTYCEDPNTGCYTIDLNGDGSIEEQNCIAPDGDCSLTDADNDGFADDTFCQDPSTGCFVLDVNSVIAVGGLLLHFFVLGGI